MRQLRKRATLFPLFSTPLVRKSSGRHAGYTNDSGRGIVFYLFSRILLAVVLTTLIVPLVYMPVYKNRISDLMQGQAESFIRNLIAVQRDALYREDYALVIDYTQKVLGEGEEITTVTLKRFGQDALKITPDSWRIINKGSDQESEKKTYSESERHGVTVAEETPLVISRPINISNFKWGTVQVDVSGKRRAKLMREYYINFITFSVVLMFGVLLLGYFLSRPIVRQLNTLRKSALEIAEGDLASRVVGSAIGELGPLSFSFNRMAEALEIQTARIGQLAKVVEEAQEGVAIFDGSGHETFANSAFERLFDSYPSPRPNSLGKLLACFEARSTEMEGSDNGTALGQGPDYLLKNSHPPLHVEISQQTLDPLKNGEPQKVLTVTDITWRKGLEARLSELALFDKLTALPNRRQFLGALDAAFEQSTPFAVLFMDLDNFKIINDTLGHEAGDLVLSETAQRLRHLLRPEDVVARLGGDEFTAIVYGIANEEEAGLICKKINTLLKEPISSEDRSLRVGVSIGAVLAPEATTNPSEVLRFADIAMYHTKNTGKSDYSIFEPKMLIAAMSRVETEEALSNALSSMTLLVYYQPIVSAAGELIALEALARWPESELTPDQFIPIAEESDLIVQLDCYVFEQTLQQANLWELAKKGIRISVNVSARTVQSKDILSAISTLLETYEFPAELIQLEITESVLINQANRIHVQETLISFRKLGCRVALDDFGRGYSSLRYLLDFDIDVIKFDRAFVARILENPKAAAIVGIILRMASALGVETVAEGVETAEQASWLANRRCDYLQGYLYSRPLPAQDLASDWPVLSHIRQSRA